MIWMLCPHVATGGAYAILLQWMVVNMLALCSRIVVHFKHPSMVYCCLHRIQESWFAPALSTARCLNDVKFISVYAFNNNSTEDGP